MIDTSFPEPNYTSEKKEVGRLGSFEEWMLKDQREKTKGERWKPFGHVVSKQLLPMIGCILLKAFIRQDLQD